MTEGMQREVLEKEAAQAEVRKLKVRLEEERLAKERVSSQAQHAWREVAALQDTVREQRAMLCRLRETCTLASWQSAKRKAAIEHLVELGQRLEKRAEQRGSPLLGSVNEAEGLLEQDLNFF